MIKKDLYHMIQCESLGMRAWWMAGKPESGYCMSCVPTNTLLRRWIGEEDRDVVYAMQQEFIELLGIRGTPSVIPGVGEDYVVAARQMFREQPHMKNLVFDSYIFHSQRQDEAAWLYEEVASEFRQFHGEQNCRVFLPNATAVDQWHNKAFFRQQVTSYYGTGAVPYGEHFENPSAEQLAAFVATTFRSGKQKVILKKEGGGGSGNLILTPTDNVAEKIAAFLADKSGSNSWVTGEYWEEWKYSFCVSFFILSESQEPVHLEISEQVLNPVNAGFLGGKSFNKLSMKDREFIVATLRPIIAQQSQDGIRGFTAIDLILCEPDPAREQLVLPDSGLALLFIEANVRLNGHNQERAFIAHLARREGIDPDGIIHVALKNRALGTTNREEAKLFFERLLYGIAQPLTLATLQNGAYFIVTVNTKEKDTPGNGVILFGIDSPETIAKIEFAYSLLLQKNILL